jgi:putative tricarboxylic transport membrane protein
MRNNRRPFGSDHIVLLLMLVLAAAYFFATEQIAELQMGDPLGPKAFPRILVVALLISAGMLFFEIRGKRSSTQEESLSSHAGPAHFILLSLIVAWTFIYFALFETLGYVIATTIFLLALTTYFNRGKWVANILSCTLFTVATYEIFRFLGVFLPKGLLPY